MDKRVVLKIQRVEMKNLKKGDKFLVLDDGSLITGVMEADAKGYVKPDGTSAVDAHLSTY
jgi:hypothetical protein